MIIDPAIIRAGHRAQLHAAIGGLKRLDLLGAVGGQPILQIDAGQRGGKLAQIGGRRPDLGRELAEGPMVRLDGRVRAGQHQRQPLGIGAAGLHMDAGRLHQARPAVIGPAPHHRGQFAERQEALVIRPGEPFRRHAADPLAARDIHLVAATSVATGIQNLHVHGDHPP